MIAWIPSILSPIRKLATEYDAKPVRRLSRGARDRQIC